MCISVQAIAMVLLPTALFFNTKVLQVSGEYCFGAPSWQILIKRVLSFGDVYRNTDVEKCGLCELLKISK